MTTSKPVKRASSLQLRIGERRALLIAGDFIMGVIALFIALYLWGASEKFLGSWQEFLTVRVPGWFFLFPIFWVILLVELYDVHRASDWGRAVRGVAMAALAGLLIYLALFFYYADTPKSLLPRRGVASFFVAVTLLTLLWRWIYIRVFETSLLLRRVLLVGGGNTGQMLIQVANELSHKPFVMVGVVDDDHRKLGTYIEGVQVIGTSEQLPKLVEDNQVSEVIVAISGDMNGRMFQALLDVQETGIEITRMPVTYEELLGRVPVQSLEANWILRSFVDELRVSGFYIFAKRVLDLLGGLFGLILMLITLPFVAVAILLDDGFPIFYSQIRSGRGGQPYNILKYRTMRRDAEADGQPRWAQEADTRATRVGRILRKTHIDELPQFINVVKGEMSLVGPRAERPELVEMFQKHIPFYRARLLVKPGISGWAQVNFGYASTIEETRVKLEYDLYYIKHRSLMMDLIILLRTPATMLGFRGR